MKQEKSSWLGALARRIARRLVKIYYPRIEITGAELPGTGPVLLCGNHPNSLVDPILIGIACRRPVRFMAKAPLFKTPVMGPVMYGLGMIPAYRGSDDKKQVRRNLESLDKSAQVLVEGHAVGIFPEGKSHDAVHVEMVRSGVARIAVKAVEQGADELIIVPMGLNYDSKEQFRSSIWVQVGQPIEVQSWLRESGEQGRKATRELTNELEKRLKSVVIHLEDPEREDLLEELEVLIQGDVQSDALHLRKQIADAINFFLTKDPGRAESVADQLRDNRDSVHACGLTSNSLVLRKRGLRLFGELTVRIVGMLIGLVPALIGLIFHLIPFSLVRVIARFVQPPGRTAISLYRVLCGLPVYAIWYVATLILAVWMQVPAWLVALTLLLMPMAGVIALTYWPNVGHFAIQTWRQILLLLQPKKCQILRQDRDSIRSRLISMADEYKNLDGQNPDPKAS